MPPGGEGLYYVSTVLLVHDGELGRFEIQLVKLVKGKCDHHLKILTSSNGQWQFKQDYIPVGCVPPTHWPYLPACSASGCTWSGGVPGPSGVYLVQGVYLVPGVLPGPGGCTWSWGVYLVTGRCLLQVWGVSGTPHLLTEWQMSVKT